MTKQTQIQIRVSTEEKRLLQEAAQRAGLSLSAWLIQQAQIELKKPREKPTQVIEKKEDKKNQNPWL